MNLTDADLVTVLEPWLPQRRWFAAKGHRLTDLQVAARHDVGGGGEHVILAGHIDGKQWQVYQVPIWASRQSSPDSLIGWCGPWAVHDGLAHADVVHALLAGVPGDARLNPMATGEAPAVQWREHVASGGQCRVLDVEQSNTSVVLGDAVLVKFFRLLGVGINPDIEVHAGLADVGCHDIGRLLGWINGGWRDAASGQTVHGHLAMIQEFFADSIDGWDLARQQVARGAEFAEESGALGAATARVHRDLARAFPVTTLAEPQVLAMARRLHARLSAASQIVPDLQPLEDALHVRLDGVADLSGLDVQRVHGDFHLGQALRTPAGWRVLDFEGEPGGELDTRRVLDHPLRDVAGMLRSFAYAAWQGAGNSDEALAWRDRCEEAFLAGYTSAGGPDPCDNEVLLAAYTIDKAAYEAVYEQRNRPDWVEIPLSALRQLAGG